MNIIEVKPLQDFTLHVKADNGESGVFDVRPYFQFEPFAPLRKLDEFVKVHNGRYFVEWECGADLSADTIFAKWSLRKDAQPGDPRDTLQAARG